MNKVEILKKAGISKDFDRYEVEDCGDEYKIYDTIGDILGCILVGTGLADINKDGKLDVTNSKVAMQKLLDKYPKGFDLEIIFDVL
jgi:hypothetical protein